MAAVLEHHAARTAPDHLLRADHVHRRELQGLRPHRRDDRRWAGPGDEGAVPAHLRGRHPGGPLRARLGDLARALPPGRRVHGRPVPDPATAGGRMTANLTVDLTPTPGATSAARGPQRHGTPTGVRKV